MTRSKPAATRPRHASPSLLAPSRSLLAIVTMAVLAALGIAGCAAMTSRTVSSRPQAGGPSIPHLALDRAVAAHAVTFRAADIATGVAGGTWFTTGRGASRRVTPTDPATAAALDPTTPSSLAGSGIPVTALAAYKQAAVRESARRPACGLVWPLLAGIGRVESNHGRFAGALLHTDGYSTPRIVGIPLDGHGTALIRDTDGGRLDGDTVFDRAVGPMQFIPSTWAGWGVDANHDGRSDPNNIFDAAAAAADYLCAAGRDLRTYAGQVQAVRSYNNSDAYIALVLGLEKEYASGVVGVTIPVLPTDPDPGTVHPRHPPKLPPVDPGKPRGLPKPAPKPAPTPTPTSSAPGAPTTAVPSTSSAPPSGSSSTPGNGTSSTDVPSDPSSSDSPSSDPPSTDAPSTDTSSTEPPATDTSGTTSSGTSSGATSGASDPGTPVAPATGTSTGTASAGTSSSAESASSGAPSA